MAIDPRAPAVVPARVLRIALRDHARVIVLAQNPANAGAFKAKPREVPRGAPVNCSPTFGWWWRKNGSLSTTPANRFSLANTANGPEMAG